MRSFRFAASLLPLALVCGAFAAERAIPFLSGPVIDEGGFLNPSEIAALGEQIRASAPTAQIQVWTLPSLEGEPIESLAIRAVEKWKLGSEKGDNGILILATKEDRRLRIEVGRGLEGDIPDIISNRIVENVIVPNFRDGRFYEGFSGAAAAIVEYAGGPPAPGGGVRETRRAVSPLSKYWRLFEIALFLLIFAGPFFLRLIGIGSLFGRRRGIFGGSSWGGSSWGRGGGGGGWSGGGGSFGGGGSSGSW